METSLLLQGKAGHVPVIFFPHHNRPIPYLCMETKIIKTITRLDCPETNSSSSHSFILSIKPFDPKTDLSGPAQTLIPIETPDGKKVITLDGRKDFYEESKRTNSSKSKAIYLIAAARGMFSDKTAKKKVDIIKDVIKETLSVDEVLVKNAKDWDIDHQSRTTMETILKSDTNGIKEFIFNPRSWLFLLWDSEDGINNPIYDIPGLLIYEAGFDLPILIEKFLEKPEIQYLEYYDPFRNYPSSEEVFDAISHLLIENNITGYSKSQDAMILRENDTTSYFHRKYFGIYSNNVISDEDVFLPLGLVHDEENIYTVFLKSTVWGEAWEFYKNKREEKMNSFDLYEFRKEYKDLAVDPEQAANGFIDHYFIDNEYIRKQSDLKLEFGIKDEDVKLIKINIRRRETSENYL